MVYGGLLLDVGVFMLLLAIVLWISITFAFKDIIKKYTVYTLYPAAIFVATLIIIMSKNGLGHTIDLIVLAGLTVTVAYYAWRSITRTLCFKDTLIIPLTLMILTLIEILGRAGVYA
jgi:hypothetical protein